MHKVDHATSQNRDVTGTHLRPGSFLKPLYFLVGLLQLLYQLFFAYAREHSKKNHQQQKQATFRYRMFLTAMRLLTDLGYFALGDGSFDSILVKGEITRR